MGVKGRVPKVEKPIKQVKISLHKQLTLQAAKWLRKHESNISIPNCPFIASEWLTYTLIGEMPDVIGWCNWTSVLIEVKVGRGDFLADAKKPFRKFGKEGMGEHRYYLCPAGLIKDTELPYKWGLLYLNDRNKIDIIKVAERQDANLNCERSIMFSMLRRTNKPSKN